MLQGELKRIDPDLARVAALRESVECSRAASERALEYLAGRKVWGLLTVARPSNPAAAAACRGAFPAVFEYGAGAVQRTDA